MQCASNMRQLGLAALNYHSAQSSFPPGRKGDPTAATWGWTVFLLPFLDQNVVFKKLDLTRPVPDPANAILPVAPLAFLRCPSDTDRLDDSADPLAMAGSTKTNYRGNGGNDTGELDANGNENNNGLFLTNQEISIDQITDGASATALFSEGLLGDGDNDAISKPGDWFAISPASHNRNDIYAALLTVTPGGERATNCLARALPSSSADIPIPVTIT